MLVRLHIAMQYMKTYLYESMYIDEEPEVIAKN